MITEQDVRERFMSGLDCGQAVLMEVAEPLGYEKQEAARIASAFGGGMFHGDTCGAVLGAMLAIGMAYGHDKENDMENKAKLKEKVAEFQKEFTEKNGSTFCRELIDYDFAKEGELEKAAASGQLFTRCPKYVIDALEILEDIL